MKDSEQIHHATVFDDATRHVARIYAEALLGAADKRQQTQEVLEQLEELVREVLARDSAFALFLASAVVSGEHKREVLRRAFQGKVNDVLYHFLLVLNDHDRLGIIRETAVLMRDIFERRAGRMHVEVKSAIALDEEQRERLRRELRDKFHREPILSVRVDPELLGGLVVKVDDWVFDDSVRARLDRIRNQLIEKGSLVHAH
ncbi:MAG TPA: ATP synthase F1 subunit delta [Gemmataceae bacterium]|jgi:F-type H+-transporting ATPase subunit delta